MQKRRRDSLIVTKGGIGGIEPARLALRVPSAPASRAGSSSTVPQPALQQASSKYADETCISSPMASSPPPHPGGGTAHQRGWFRAAASGPRVRLRASAPECRSYRSRP
eukprot:scaffold16407_cov127-Isochrysis_galbana.AAC.6